MERGTDKEHHALADEVEEITLDPEQLEKRVRIGAGLLTKLHEEIIHVLTTLKIILAWGLEHMPGLISQSYVITYPSSLGQNMYDKRRGTCQTKDWNL